MPQFEITVKTDVKNKRITAQIEADHGAAAAARLFRRKFWADIKVRKVKIKEVKV